MSSVRGRSSDAAFPSIGGPPPPLSAPTPSATAAVVNNPSGGTGRMGPGNAGLQYEVIPTVRVTGKGKMMAVKVQMLDDGVAIFQVQAKALGRVLFEQVCRQLSLLEADYFGLEYTDGHGNFYWVDLSKPMKDQMVLNTLRDPILRFCVKFYPPDPAQLEEEYTRYLFCLQVKRDMTQGHLACNENTGALLASYLVQAECGDYAAEDYPDPSYLSSHKFVPQQDAELERMIMENHKKHVGQTPAEADLNFLETARRCELYGVKMTQAKDHDGTPLNLAVSHMGIMVFQKFIRINTFSWAKVRKLSFKRKKFLVKLHPEGYVNIGGVYYKDQVEFFFDGRDECKNFWKKCVEYHGFFRCSSVKRIPRHRPKVMSRGSSFRYVGRTQKEMMDFVRGNFVKRQSFQRSQSFRHPLHSVLGSHPNLGQPTPERHASQPAHPLLPIGDVLIGAQSMGSISLSRGGTLSRKERGGTGDNSVASAAAMLGSRGAHSPVSPSHTDPGGELPDFEERRSMRGDGNLSSRGDDDGKRHHYELPETPSVATSKQTTSVTSSPQRMPTTTDEDEFSSSPRRLWHQQRQPGSNLHRPVVPDERLARDASLDRGDYDLNDNADEANNNPDGNQSPQPASPDQQVENESPAPPPPPPPLMDEEGNDMSLSGLVERVISPLTALAQETRNSIIGSSSIHNYPDGYARNGGVNGLDTNENEVTGRGAGLPDAQQERHAGDRAYFIAKEILMTERTYKKDLEVIEIWLRDELCNSGEEETNSDEDGMPRLILEQLFSIHDPIFDFHSALLQELEDRVGSWEQKPHTQRLPGSGARIGEVFHNSMPKMTPMYLDYLKSHRDVMEGLEYALRDSPKFDLLIREFENQKVCYLPLFNFILKPLHRLTHYQALLRRLVSYYGIDHPDLTSCKAALTLMSDLVARVGEVLPASDNYAKLVELQRELSGFDTLVQPERLFVREGCLQKLSRKGYQQRMFFLFSDVLVYAARVTQPQLQFRVHGIMPVRNIVVEEADGRTTVPHSFTIFGGNRALMVAAGSAEEKRNWLSDFNKAIASARERPETAIQYLSLKSASSAEDIGQKDGEKSAESTIKPASQVNQRSNTSVHVCWHRNTSVSSLDLRLAANSQLSGYLLRKFKNSSGWQKLWVVFTNFCLFFYKTYQDDFPLASLPLLSYRVTTPTPLDDIGKDFVFKLQFKNHVYFFRAESEYTFNRWMEVIGNATNRTFDFGTDIPRSPSLR